MLLKSIAIAHFQQYEKPFQLAGLTPGINVIYGDNEAGKSTLLRALRAVLFDRFNGMAADSFAGYKGGSPEVKIEFDLNNSSYSLEKIFSRKKDGRAVLANEKGIQWTGYEAEIKLAELLTFDNVERGLAKAEQQGICGVLWVEQGNAWQQVAIANNIKASQTIQNVLSHELTDMLSRGKGESLLKKFTDELNEFQTEKSAKPRGQYKDKLDAKAFIEQKVKDLDKELTNYQKKIDQLADYQQELAILVDNQIEEKDKEQLEQAQQHLKHVEEVNQHYEQCKQNLKLSELKQNAAETALNERNKLIDNLHKETENHDELVSQIEELNTGAEQLRKNLEAAKEALRIAKKNHEHSLLAIKKAQDYQKLLVIEAHVKRMDEQLQQVNTLKTTITHKQQSLLHLSLDANGLKNLKKLNERVHSLQMRFDAIATRIDYLIQDDAVKINDHCITGKGVLFISDKSTITFGNSQLFITPGREELSAVETQLAEAKKELKGAFEAYHISSMSEADDLVDKKNTLSNDIALLSMQINVIAPNGIELLEKELTENRLEVIKLKNLLSEADLESLEKATEQEQLSLNELTKCSDTERYVHDQFITKDVALKHATIALSTTKDSVFSLKNKLGAARTDQSDEALQTTKQAIVNETQQLTIKLDLFETALKNLDHEGALSEVKRRQHVLDTTRDRVAELKQQVRDLSIELQTSGHRGLAEEKEQAEQQSKDLNNDVERLERHVGSLNLLHELIKANIQSAKEMLVKPLTESMAPYLKILFSGAEPVIDEAFSLQHIVRDGIREPFENLSIGTREQLAIILRLAYADLLAEKGTSVPVILDDALVNSDDLRREKMKQILHRASKKHQIILLTCHGNDYRDSGGKFLAI